MNLDKLDIVKISNTNYKLYNLVNGQRINITLNFENIKSPFGLEKFQNVYYINWELNTEYANLIKQFDLEIKDIITTANEQYTSWSWTSNVKEKYGFKPLLKTRLLQTKNKFIVECITSPFEINYKNNMNIILIIDSIWFNEKNKTFGLLWIVKKIT